MPYNYLVDPVLRKSLGAINWCWHRRHCVFRHARLMRAPRRSAAVVLFDEAHNLVRR